MRLADTWPTGVDRFYLLSSLLYLLDGPGGNCFTFYERVSLCSSSSAYTCLYRICRAGDIGLDSMISYLACSLVFAYLYIKVD
jgi:hypothetical protein